MRLHGPDEYGSSYIYLVDDVKPEVARTMKAYVNLDIDKDNNIIGIELYNTYNKLGNQHE